MCHKWSCDAREQLPSDVVWVPCDVCACVCVCVCTGGEVLSRRQRRGHVSLDEPGWFQGAERPFSGWGGAKSPETQ